MAGPRRPRRRGAGSSNDPSTASKIMLGALGLFSVLYLFSSHILVTRQGPGMHSPHQGGGGADVAVDDVPYDRDPRNDGGGTADAQQWLPQNDPAEGPMDYIPLQCAGGVPDVDLSYWKDIPQDK